MTTAEYLATPETKRPQELIFGALRVADSPTPIHQRAVRDLFKAVDAHVSDRGLGEVWLSPLDVILDDENHLVVQPDLFFISKERDRIVTDRVRGAPDLVIEVLSPRPRVGTVGERLNWFARYRVRECWLVHQIERWVEAIGFSEGSIATRKKFTEDERIRSSVLPEFDRTLFSILGY